MGTSNAGDGIEGSSTAANKSGVWGHNDLVSGYGVAGSSTSGIGVGGWTTNGIAVFGFANALSGLTYGMYARNDSASGRGVFGWATPLSGITYGVYGQSDSPSGYGVYGTGGTGVLGTSSTGDGIEGSSTAANKSGVWGHNDSGYGVAGSSTDGIGVQGLTKNYVGVYGLAYGGSGTTYGVIGQSFDGYGVYSSGNFAATGTKSFQIDHPLMPETHYLNHFCTEGPEPYNVYRGNVVTDARGYATVQLPDYFESINREPTYHLTVIDESDDFVLAKVVREIQNNQFVIRTNKPDVKVSWRVEAIRNDLWVQKYGFKTEQEKPEMHRGKYLHPELYGMPKEYGIHYSPNMEKGERNARNLESSRVSDLPRISASGLKRVSSQKKMR
ncbi:MAG TPA: hypothetical protein VNK96_07055 [Fimbriimonadales bacterium]|nr:hypothetical protein [Fimbriimonadales bacterium]